MALLAVGAVVYIVRYRRRTAALRRMAAAKGWTYKYAVYPTFTLKLTAPPFDGAGRRAVRHLIEGKVGDRPFRAFDYWLTLGQISEHWGVVITPVPASMPLIMIDRRHGMHGDDEGALASGSEIATESEELNRRVRIATVSPKTASDVMAPAVVQLLLDGGDTLSHIRFNGDIAVSVGHEIAMSEDVAERINALCTLVESIPSFVWKDHPLEGASPRPRSEPA